MANTTISSLQPDLAHRYRLIGAILAELRPASPGSRLRLLDLGAGPESLVEAVMPPWCELHRADVDTFGRGDITLLLPGEPLPFADAAFDVVLALEVLEHVPLPDRPLFLDECLRVSSRTVVLSTPLGTGTTRHIEAVFRHAAESISGKTIPFLEEHAAYGLPDPELTASALARLGAQVVTLDNAPAAEWLVANLVDFLYAARFGEGEQKSAQNAAQNRVLPTSRVGSAHYRRFYCASRDAADFAALSTLQERQATEAPALTPEALAEFAVERLTSVVRDLEIRHAQHLQIKDTRTAQLEQHVTGLDEVVAGLRSGLDVQQQHIGELESSLSKQIHATHAAEAEVRRAVADGKKARLRAEAIQAERDQRAAADEERLRLELLTLEGAAADARRQRDHLERQLARTNLQLLRTGLELAALSQSVMWRATAPVRRAVAYARTVSMQAAVQWRRFQQRGKPASAWPTGLSRRILTDSGLFDPAWYLSTYQDVAAAGADPLDHFLSRGASEGRRPTPLFDTVYYLSRYPDVGASGLNPVVHYVLYGGREGHWVNLAFDSGYYLLTYPDVAASGLTPLAHYIRFGAAEGRQPSAEFDPACYLEINTDVRDAGLDPLEHYALTGAHEGRRFRKMPEAQAVPAMSSPATRSGDGYVPPPGLLPWFSPLNTVLDPTLAATPRLNVLLPGLGMRHMSGGPNTVLAFVARLAAHGIPIRLVSTDAPVDDDPAPFWAHVAALAGGQLPPDMELVDAHDRSKPWRIGEDDEFFATAWWTAQQVKYAIRLTRTKKFVYFIQDFEPLFHAASTAQALAEETYALDYVPVLNTRILADFFTERRIGRFADPAFAADAVVFEPALDRALFHPAPRAVRARRRVLFYARPTSGLRNLFELAVAALQQAVAEGVLPADQWEFLGMGEAFAPVDLGHGAVLRPAPWLGLQEYADQMRESDVLLSLMMSPHPSYPPLEMAACGGVAVTTVYANKDAARLAGMSPRILGVAATIEGLVSGLARAVAMPAAEEPADVSIALPQSWDEAFSAVVPQVATRIRQLMGLPVIAASDGAPAVTFPGYHWPRQAYDLQRLRALERRRHEYRSPSHPLLFSVITPVWDTDPVFLEELCLSVLRQDCAPDLFEWVVVDNASTRAETRAVLDRWAAADARLRVHRADGNLGILGGLRACLERARGRYVVTVDHDDLLTPDALRVLGHILAARGYPLVAYSDEDKIDGA